MNDAELKKRIKTMLQNGMSQFEVETSLATNIDVLVQERIDELYVKLGEARRELRKLAIMSARADIDGMPISDEVWVEKVQEANLNISCLEQEMEEVECEVYKSLGLG